MGAMGAQLAVISTGCHLAVMLVISQAVAVISTDCHLALRRVIFQAMALIYQHS